MSSSGILPQNRFLRFQRKSGGAFSLPPVVYAKRIFFSASPSHKSVCYSFVPPILGRFLSSAALWSPAPVYHNLGRVRMEPAASDKIGICSPVVPPQIRYPLHTAVPSALRHRRTIPHARLGGQSAPQMRCKTLQYKKYSCGFAPFCGTNFRADPHALTHAVTP